MIKQISYLAMAVALMSLALVHVSPAVRAAAEIGEMAPAFTATDINGDEFSLEDQKGKIVVLEWTNHLCPFVKKHYSSGNMQTLQKSATDNGVVWVSIVSSAPEKQGSMSAEEAQALVIEKGANATTRIMDPSGAIGKMYDAKTTPHMFVISPEGKLVYNGAIDDNPNPDPKSIEGSKNLVMAALDDLSAGRVVEIPRTAPYGCSVKY
ncbi:MAG: thioredoxin family protein [Alphaproteobacteria bacterium]